MIHSRKHRTLLSGLSAVAAVAAAGTAVGQPAPDQELEELRRQIDSMTERLESLEAADEEHEETAETLELVEELVFDLDEKVGDRALVRAFDAINLDIGGFLTQTYTVAVGEGGTEDSFNQTQFELLIGADVNEDISLFTALGFLREADLNLSDPEEPSFDNFANRVPQIIAWANYRQSDALEVRIGRYVTPHGIINIEHFPPVLLEVNQPQFLRPFSGNSIFPNFLTGIDIHGKLFVGSEKQDVFSYNVYAGHFNGPSDPDNIVAGARAQYAFGQSGFTAGLNYAHGRREGVTSPLGNFSVTPVGSLTTNDYDLFGADLLYDKGRILWKTEVFFSNERGEEDRFAVYTQPAYRFSDKWIGFYRFDHFDPGQGLTISNEHVFGVNYLPVSTVRLRGEYILKDFADSDTEANFFQLSATISF